MRIVSLLPAATEIVAALGLGEHLVGRSHECDFPSQVAPLQSLTIPKMLITRDNAAIDQAVNELVAKGLSIYEVNTQRLNEVAPDFIITQSQCEVCAVSYDVVAEAVKTVVGHNPQIVDLRPDSYQDIFEDIIRVGKALDRANEARGLVDDMQQRINNVSQQVSSEPHSPTVACIEWLSPLMNAGNWMPDLVEKAGGINLLGKPGAHSHELDWAEIQISDPDVIIVMPCGYGIAQIREEMKFLTQQPGWSDLRAVKNGQVFLVDANQYFNRPGPRIVDSVEILAEIFYPHLFTAEYAPGGWVPYHGVHH